MRLLAIVVLAGSLVVIRAGCFGSGPTVAADNIRDALPSICISLGGHFVEGERRYQCVTDTAGIKWDLSLKVSHVLPVFLVSLTNEYQCRIKVVLVGKSRISSVRMDLASKSPVDT